MALIKLWPRRLSDKMGITLPYSGWQWGADVCNWVLDTLRPEPWGEWESLCEICWLLSARSVLESILLDFFEYLLPGVVVNYDYWRGGGGAGTLGSIFQCGIWNNVHFQWHSSMFWNPQQHQDFDQDGIMLGYTSHTMYRYVSCIIPVYKATYLLFLCKSVHSEQQRQPWSNHDDSWVI